MTVPVEEVPPATEVGLTVTLVKAAGLIVKLAVGLVPFKLAVMVALVTAPTAAVVTVKVAVVAPDATVKVAGTVALVELDDRLTTVPDAPAAELIVTVPVDVFPPMTDVGFKVTKVAVMGLIVSVAV